ncbi:MAG: TraR/DksA C4-type zinc finger protein [Armatimonadota bacterium]|nr:TraR/DksA C4-type zinc finger protein [Armatimonadota bacterium]MDW8156881.1 TraR/DksA C4-type zinc finger protein [Armatimonadota bacterium]
MAKKKESGAKRAAKKAQKATAKPARKRAAAQQPARKQRTAAQPAKQLASERVTAQTSLSRPSAGTPAGSVLLKPPRVDLPSPTPPRPAARPSAVAAAAAGQVQPVTQADYPEFRRLLLAERDRLLQELAALGERLQQVEEIGLVEAANEDDYGDVASEAFEREKGFALETSVQGMLRMVEDALRKLDAGTYGTCERCGGAIDVERLRALPFASLCIRCKAEQEQQSNSGNGWSS